MIYVSHQPPHITHNKSLLKFTKKKFVPTEIVNTCTCQCYVHVMFRVCVLKINLKISLLVKNFKAFIPIYLYSKCTCSVPE